MAAGERHDRGGGGFRSDPERVADFARRYSDTFPARHLALCPVCGASVPMFLRRWVEVGILLNETGRAPRFQEDWQGARPRFAWFRW